MMSWSKNSLWSKRLNREIEVQHYFVVWICGVLLQCSQDNMFIEVDRMCAQGRAKMTGKILMENDCCEWKLRTASCSTLGLLPSSMYQSSDCVH